MLLERTPCSSVGGSIAATLAPDVIPDASTGAEVKETDAEGLVELRAAG